MSIQRHYEESKKSQLNVLDFRLLHLPPAKLLAPTANACTLRENHETSELEQKKKPEPKNEESGIQYIYSCRSLPLSTVLDPSPIKNSPPSEIMQWISTHSYVLNVFCFVSLFPLVIEFSQGDHPYRGCLYLITSPITNSSFIFFNLHHRNTKWITLCMAMISLLLGNTAAILYCSSSCLPRKDAYGIDFGQLSLSVALIFGAVQLLLLMTKSNVAVVMISTASGVVVCGLSMAALFLPSNIGRRCYQSSIPCILWLFWQASQSRLSHTQ